MRVGNKMETHKTRDNNKITPPEREVEIKFQIKIWKFFEKKSISSFNFRNINDFHPPLSVLSLISLWQSLLSSLSLILDVPLVSE